MATPLILDDDVVRIYAEGQPKKQENLIATLFWGDRVEVVEEREEEGKTVRIVAIPRRVWNAETSRYESVTRRGVLPPRATFRDEPLLKVRFVDVGQGDGAMVETPEGKLLLIDGGEEEHLRRYVNVAFSHLIQDGPLPVSAIVVTHGDADHFEGLTKLAKGIRNRDEEPLISVERVFHNGLVKTGAERDREAFGATVEEDGTVFATELVDDLLAHEGPMNRPFSRWRDALLHLRENGSGDLAIRRLEAGDDEAFDFLEEEGIRVQVLGPVAEEIEGKSVLRFLNTPGSSSLSASHTVNGHSIVLRLTYGNVRFLFGADLNEESEAGLLEWSRQVGISLAAEILKVPHHGSADFSPQMLEAVRPVVSVVSSGDENQTKEYIHPRAGLIGALGKYSRPSVARPLIYVTEMVAFFERLGTIEAKRVADGEKKDLGRITSAYRKLAYGIVHVRTDGDRVLVATHSGKSDTKESYAFHVNETGEILFEEKTSVL